MSGVTKVQRPTRLEPWLKYLNPWYLVRAVRDAQKEIDQEARQRKGEPGVVELKSERWGVVEARRQEIHDRVRKHWCELSGYSPDDWPYSAAAVLKVHYRFRKRRKEIPGFDQEIAEHLGLTPAPTPSLF